MDDYLKKPIRPGELAEALERTALERTTPEQTTTQQAAPQAAPPAAAALEPGALDNLLESTGGDAEFVATLLETFGDDASATLADLRAGLDAGDGEAVRRAAHTLKSNAATFGASALAELCDGLA